MAKRSKKPRDINAMAAAIVAEATDESEPKPPSPRALTGRLGGLKGGKARAKKLSAERRTEIAKRAAQARWQRTR